MEARRLGETTMTIEELGEFEQEHLASMTFDSFYDTDIFILEKSELEKFVELSDENYVNEDDAGNVMVAFFLPGTEDDNVTIWIYALDDVYSDIMKAVDVDLKKAGRKDEV